MHAELMRWHRRVGLTAAVLVVLAAVTGVLIQHADALGLARKPVRAAWLLRLYGAAPVRCERAFAVASHWWSQCGTRLFLDGAMLDAPPIESLLGVQPVAGGWLLVDRSQALMLSQTGALVDRLPYPRALDAVRSGRAADKVLIETKDGARWLADAQMTAWAPVTPGSASPVWQQTAELPARWREVNEAKAPDGAPTLERVLLDVHAGRWLGSIGPWLMDAAAVALIVLAGTGVWRASRRAQRGVD